jgi:hypothetical protein
LNNREIMVIILAAFQLTSFGSTGFIEEEHEAWFFLGASSLSILAFLTPTTRKYHYLLGVVLIRVLRGWSHNGLSHVATLRFCFSLLCLSFSIPNTVLIQGKSWC